MQTLTKAELAKMSGHTYPETRIAKVLEQSATDQKIRRSYDVFLSHSFLDKETILQIRDVLQNNYGLSVFVDWIEKPELDRRNVTPETANQLREAMNNSKSLIYAVSENSATSTWMPWELGYSDARHSRVAVFPIAGANSIGLAAAAVANRNNQFIGLYPVIRVETAKSGDRFLWAEDSNNSRRYARLDLWEKDGQSSLSTNKARH